MATTPPDPARMAAVDAALERIEVGMTLGLGSGRAVWALVAALAQRHGSPGSLRVVPASSTTEDLAQRAGFEVVGLDGRTRIDLAIDGADEVDPDLSLLKGHGAALLREKLVVGAAARFVVLAEEHKLVDRLGQRKRLPVEVVRFAWADTGNRLAWLLEDVTLRLGPDGTPVVTDEGHYILDGSIADGAAPATLDTAIKGTLGVVEHGLFIDMADEVLIGHPDGSVEVRSA